MSQLIFLTPATKLFRGVFTDGVALPGETMVTLTDAQYADWNALARPDPLGLDRQRYVLFDAAASPSFFYGSLIQCAAAAQHIDDMLYWQFARISGDSTLDFIRAKLMVLRSTINTYDDIYGPNFGIVRQDIRTIVATALQDETNSTVLGIQADALAAAQWNLP